MRKRAWIVSAVLCTALTLSGCGGKDINYKTDDSDASGTDPGISEEAAADENGGLLAQQLGIPESAKAELPVDGTDLKKITLDDKDIIVPDKDRMYTKSYRIGILTDTIREEIVKSFLDESEGIYNYSQELFDDQGIERTDIDKYFEDHSGEKPDYSGEYFIGKMDGVPYIVRFMDTEWSIDEAFAVSRAYPEEITDEMAARQIESITYYDYNPDDLKADTEKKKDSTDKEAENSCGMDPEQAGRKAAEDMASWGFRDVVQTSITDMYKGYEGSGYNVIEYDKDGYIVRFDASINDTAIYQPVATTIDTITSQNGEDGFVDTGSYYYSERSYYQMSFNEDGIVTFYGYWPMRSDDDLHQVDKLITWDEAVEGLKKAIPQHFAGYTGYSEVTFNDVRLTYFRTKTGDKEYEVIPVYVFAQLESWADESDAPTQLIMIDARDGSEVDVMQDPGRQGLI